MKLKDITVYLAAPTNQIIQVETRDKLSSILVNYGISYYAPKDILNKNFDALFRSNLLLAVLDDRDPIVLMEFGIFMSRLYSYIKLNKPAKEEAALFRIITYSDRGFGVEPIMKSFISGHFTNISSFRDFLTSINNNEDILEDSLFTPYTNFTTIPA